MLGRLYERENCSAARALELVGERWSLLIVRDALFAGSSRFNDFRRLGIATNILAARLDGFVVAGIMERRASPDSDHSAYVLTDRGRDLATVVIALTEWGDRWVAEDGPPIRYTHDTCGGQVSLTTTCDRCGEVHDPGAVLARPGPGMPAEIAQRMA